MQRLRLIFNILCWMHGFDMKTQRTGSIERQDIHVALLIIYVSLYVIIFGGIQDVVIWDVVSSQEKAKHIRDEEHEEDTVERDNDSNKKSASCHQHCMNRPVRKRLVQDVEMGDTELSLTVEEEEEEEEEESLETEYVELSDLEDDWTSSDNEEEDEIEMTFSVQEPKDTEESYMQSHRSFFSSRIFLINIGDVEKADGRNHGYDSISSEERQQTYRNLLNSAEQERRRKVFCESSFYDDDESLRWDSEELYSGSSLDSGEIYKDRDFKDTIHVSQNVTLWDKVIVPENSWIDVNYLVGQLVSPLENNDQVNSKTNQGKEKIEIKGYTEKVSKSFCSKEDTTLSKSEEDVFERKRGRGKKRNKSGSRSRREKRRAQRSLREIINWQISLRRNAAVLYDFNSERGGHVFPSKSNGTNTLQEIANGNLENRGLNNGIVQSPSAEASPSIGEQEQNGYPNANSATFPRFGMERDQLQTRNLDASRQYFSNPVMGTERHQVGPLTPSLPALHTGGSQAGIVPVAETLPVIEESETSSPPSTENNSVPTSEEVQSQVRTSEETISNPSLLSVAPEADGASMTSTETLSSFFSSFSLSSVEEDEAFRYEWIRLKTFSSWPVTSLFSTVLARDGWVALGEGDRARCYSCHVVHEGWKIGDNPLQFHDNHCRFLQSMSDNVPIVREEPTRTALRTIVRDLERITDSSNVVAQENVTQQGPQAEENRNIVMNMMSKEVGEPFEAERGNLVAMSSNPQDVTPNSEILESPPAYNSSYTSRPPPQVLRPVESNPITKHSPSNPQGYSAAGAPPLPPSREAQLEALRRDPMGINFDRPKYPSYAILAVRISSFTDWPTSMTQTPRDMALAGFFYAGYGDYTRCFFCGGGLRNWEAGDDPWVEHARWFSKCAFVRQNRGQQFIDLVLRRAAEIEEQRSQDEAGNSQTNTQTNEAAQALSKEEKIMKSAAVISIKDMGYSEEMIKTAINTIKSRLPRGKHKVSAQEILEVIFELADSERTPANSSSQSEAQRTVDQSESSRPAVQSGATTENATSNVNQSDSTTEKTDQSANEEAVTTGASNGEAGTTENISNFLSNPTFDELTSLRQENSSLKDQIICKICMEKNVSIAFLPCGHLACCVDCAPAMRKCPICREFVRGTVKTYLV